MDIEIFLESKENTHHALLDGKMQCSLGEVYGCIPIQLANPRLEHICNMTILVSLQKHLSERN